MKKEKAPDSFVERPQEESSGSKSRRISIRVKDDGTIDWSQVSDTQKEAFVNAVTSDPDALEMIGAAVGDDGEVLPVGPVTEAHIKTALEWYAKGEAYAIPAFIKQRTRGKIIIPPDVATEAYTFADTTKDTMAPDGAQFFNEEVIPNLPEWLKKFIFEVGPGARFFGALAAHSVVSTMGILNYIKMNYSRPTVDDDPDIPTAASATTKKEPIQ